MKKVYRVDATGFYLEDVILHENEDLPSDCVDVPMPEGIFLPAKFENGQWATTLSQDEINALLNVPKSITPLEQTQQDQADIAFQLMLNGVI